MGNTATPPAVLPDTLAFEVVVTLEDQLALLVRCLATPAMRAGRLRREAAVVLIATACAPLFVVGGVLIGWAAAQHRPPLGPLLRSMMLDEPGALVTAVLAMAVCTVGGAALQRWLVRPRLRRMLRRILRARPDVDPSDPQLAYRARVTVSDEGLESRTGAGVTLVRWDVLKRWEETGGRIIVLGDAMTGFCVDVSTVGPGLLGRFRAILTARLGPESQPPQRAASRHAN